MIEIVLENRVALITEIDLAEFRNLLESKFEYIGIKNKDDEMMTIVNKSKALYVQDLDKVGDIKTVWDDAGKISE